MIVRIGDILNADANTVIYGLPVEQEKKAKYRRAIILTAVVVVLGVLIAWLYQITKIYRNLSYICSPFFLIAYICLPGMWILIGWWLMEMLSLVVDFKPWNHASVRYIRVGLLIVLVALFIILMSDLVFHVICDYLQMTTAGGFSFGFPYIPLISDLSRIVELLTYQYPILYSFFGIVFRLFGFPKLKKK